MTRFFFLEPATTSSTLLSGRIRGNGSAILNTSNFHASSGQGSESTLGSGAGSLGSVASGGAQLDVQSSNAESLDLFGNVLSSVFKT